MTVNTQRGSGVRRFFRLLTRDKVALLAFLFLVAVVFTAVFAPIVAPHDPHQQNLIDRLSPPMWVEGGSIEHILGTDQLGRDTLSRIIFAGRVSLWVAVAVVGTTLLVGSALGVLAGYVGGRVDHVVMATTDVVMAFPGLLLIMTVAALMGGGVFTVIVALAVRFWTAYARIARGMVLSLRETDFITAAKLIGGTKRHTVATHMIPNIVSPLATLVPLELGRVMLGEAAVSFLGLGVTPPTTSWGVLVAEGRNYISSAWWLITFAGLALFLTVLSANVFGSWLRLVLDPIHRRRE